MVKITTPNGYTVKAGTVEEAVQVVKQLEQVEIEIQYSNEECIICGSENVATFDYNMETLMCRECGSTF